VEAAHVIGIENLTVGAGTRTLVDGVSLRVERGRWCTIIGANGAGKTTLVRTVAGFITPDLGRVTLDDRDVGSLSERERSRLVAYVPQHPEIPTGMRVLDYVALGRVPYHGVMRAPSARDRRLTTEVAERVGLSSFLSRDAASLSGGERQRMVLARALCQSTPVVVLDEPTTGLDVRHQMTLLELLHREVVECGLTVLATLHDLTLAGQFADRLVLVHHGRVLMDGPSHEVVRSPVLEDAYDIGVTVVNVDGVDVVVPRRGASGAFREPR
jgi:iron complex transport system ATP-binding protein